MGIVIDVQKASHSKTGKCVTLSFINGIVSVETVLTAERSGHFCHHCRFFCKTLMLLSFYCHGIIYDVSYVVCMLFFKEAFRMPLGTVATRI